jgi:hypothetical protein
MVDLTPGEKRWTVLYGGNRAVERQAVVDLYRALQFHVPYVLPIVAAKDVDPGDFEHVVLVGTAGSNPVLADLVARGVIPAPSGAQGYTLWIGKTPWDDRYRLIAVVGADTAGVLYGVQELLASLSAANVPLDKPLKRRAALVDLPDRVSVEAPAIPDRGLWTWGYVIYDYRRFLDNMVRLKLNMLTVWNSEAPLNLPEILTYAHDRGIKVIVGYNWGWGHKLSLTSAEDCAVIKRLALDTYRKEYADHPIDGIYFQTITEHHEKVQDGRTVAARCCEMVNDIASELYAMAPNLSVQFGLHATSIREHYTDLAALDPRMIITWEDAGALPFSYAPNPQLGDGYEATLAYAKQLAAFRPGSTFAMVPKGWTCLRWEDEFAKHGPFLLGERDPAYLRERLTARQGEWNSVNAQWLRNFPLAARFYREILEINPRILSTGLVEDGMFEARIQPGVSLFAEMLWNPRQSDADLLVRAMRPYVTPTTV